jgi:hypothetical protein
MEGRTPAVPMRQWVLSVPFALRFLFASNSAAMGETLGIVYRASPGIPPEQQPRAME